MNAEAGCYARQRVAEHLFGFGKRKRTRNRTRQGHKAGGTAGEIHGVDFPGSDAGQSRRFAGGVNDPYAFFTRRVDQLLLTKSDAQARLDRVDPDERVAPGGDRDFACSALAASA